MTRDSVAALVPSFNRSIHIEARAERLTSEAGAIVVREVLDKLGIVPWLVERLADPRRPDLITHPLAELLRTAVILRALGWRDQDDADTLRDDPAFRLAVSERRGGAALATRTKDGAPLPKNPAVPDGLASQPTLSRTDRVLSIDANRTVLRESLLELAARRVRAEHGGHRQRYATLDIDSIPIEVHGEQPGAEWNGHYHARVYHPILATLDGGDILDLRLRKGSAHTAEGALDFIAPLLDRVEQKVCQVAAVRIDAGFPEEGLLWNLETRGTPYVARIKNNPVLDRMAVPHLTRPVGRPPAEPRTWFHEMSYAAKSWSRERRVVLVVQERPGELLLHHFWLLTSWRTTQMPAEALLELYRRRGAAEGGFGELMDVLDPALSSALRPKTHYRGKSPATVYPSGDAFAINETRLLLDALAFNVMHAARTLVEAATGEGWSLRRLRERLLRAAARFLVHSRRVTMVLVCSAARAWSHLWPKLARVQVADG
jgi:hypothetical protein